MKTIFAVLSIALFLAGCAGTAGTPPAGEGTTGDARGDVQRGIDAGRDNFGGVFGADSDDSNDSNDSNDSSDNAEGDSEE